MKNKRIETVTCSKYQSLNQNYTANYPQCTSAAVIEQIYV